MSKPGTPDNPLQVAVVGSGPSGFYAAEALFRSELTVGVSLFERLPAPYGLVRNGVAPDHPKLKQAIKFYARIAENEQLRYLGNVAVGRDLTLEELQAAHHAVILTCGAETDRRLGIPGEDLPGSHTATEFVGWYNGHPDYRDLRFDLSCETAVVIGQGNVAADVSRILAKSVDELQHTDIAGHALDALAESKIKHIHLIGRRGPAQAKFTFRELKEFGELPHCAPVVAADSLSLNPQSEAELAEKSGAGNKKVYDLLRDFSQRRPAAAAARRCHFTFLRSPQRLEGDGRVESLVLEKNQLHGEPFSQSARGTGETERLDAGLILRSIGYRGVPMPGAPFDEQRGVIPNRDGRVIDAGQAVPGLYTAGWIKRGPTGLIGTNKADSAQTVACLLEDLAKLDSSETKAGAAGCRRLLERRGIRYVTYPDWKKIDAAEIERGRAAGKPREKYTRVAEMLAALDS